MLIFLSDKDIDETVYDSVRNLLTKIENTLKENPKTPQKSSIPRYLFSIFSVY